MPTESKRPSGTDIRLWWVNRIFPGAIYAFFLIFAMSLMMKSKVEDTIELFVVALAFFVIFEHYLCSYRLVLGRNSLLYVHGWPARRFVRIRASKLQSWRMGGGDGAVRSVMGVITIRTGAGMQVVSIAGFRPRDIERVMRWLSKRCRARRGNSATADV